MYLFNVLAMKRNINVAMFLFCKAAIDMYQMNHYPNYSFVHGKVSLHMNLQYELANVIGLLS